MAQTHFHSLLRDRIRKEINKIEIDLARGAASDHADYRSIVGRVIGMEDCLKYCEEIEGDFDERSDSASSR